MTEVRDPVPGDPRTDGHAIFINGIPSAGKSSVAAEVMSRTSTFRVLAGDDVIRQVPYDQRAKQAARLFARTLNMVERWLESSNVIFDGAWTERHVTEAQDRFGRAGLFVILRIDESERRRRESARRDRRLGHPWDPAWHQLPGPDNIYDVVIDATAASVSQCADIVLSKAAQYWHGLQL